MMSFTELSLTLSSIDFYKHYLILALQGTECLFQLRLIFNLINRLQFQKNKLSLEVGFFISPPCETVL